MTIFTISKPAEGEKTAVENAETARTHESKKTALSPLLAVALVVLSVVIAAVVAGAIVYFGMMSCQKDARGGESVVLSDSDMDFERRGSFDDHHFSERCHYDHDNDIVIMDLEGDGFGENATVVYDFKRGFMTYVVPALNKCFIGPVSQDDVESFKNSQNGETIELGPVKPRNFTTNVNETIPSIYLAQTTSPVVNDLCSTMDSHWIEPAVDVVDDGDTSLSRQKRQEITVTVTVTKERYEFSDGTTIVVVTITTVEVEITIEE